MTFVVGLTGGLGSGKSTVAELFLRYHVPIVDADKIARDLVAPTKKSFHEIVQRFGQEILLPNGELNRSLLRKIIFNDYQERKWLETLLHPLIFEIISKEIVKIDAPYCVVVIPLLAEHFMLYQNLLDYIIVVDVPVRMQIARISARDHISDEEIEEMLQAQASPQDRLKIADMVLTNTSSILDLKRKVDDLHTFFSQTHG